MTAVAAFLLVALLAASAVAAVFLSAAMQFARQRDEQAERAEKAERQADALTVLNNEQARKLTRRRSPLVKGMRS